TQACPPGASGIPPGGETLHVKGAVRPHPPSHRIDQRSLPAADRRPAGGLAESRSFLCCFRPDYAENPYRLRSLSGLPKARRMRPASRDGKKFVVNTLRDREGALTLMVNWTARLN